MNNDQGYHKLVIWQKSQKFVTSIYQLSNTLPKSEEYNLTSQIKRAAVSVVLNIVEGHRRRYFEKEFFRFLTIADGSLTEVEACLEICLELKFINQSQFNIIDLQRRELAGMLNSFLKQIKIRSS
jgi:four helix bundle protein